MRQKKIWVLFYFIWLNILFLNQSFAMLPNADEDYPFIAKEQKLKSALRIFGRNIGVHVNIDKKISGVVQDISKMKLNREEYLNYLGAEFDFIWFYDGMILHITRIKSIETKSIYLSSFKPDMIIDDLKAAGIYQKKFIHKVNQGNGVLVVSGPKSYIEIINSFIGSPDKGRGGGIILRGSTAELNFSTSIQ